MIDTKLLVDKVVENDHIMKSLEANMTMNLFDKVVEKAKCVGKIELLNELIKEV